MQLNIHYLKPQIVIEKEKEIELYNSIVEKINDFWCDIFSIIITSSIISLSLNFSFCSVIFVLWLFTYICIMFYIFETYIFGLKINFKFQNIKYCNFNFKEATKKSNNRKIYNNNIKEIISGNLYHDINGNVFINVNKKLYFMSIDRNNDIEFYEIDEDKLEILSKNKKIKYDKIIDNEFTSLKKKVMDKIENSNGSDSDCEQEEFQNYKQKIKYLNEDKYYYLEHKDKDNTDSDNDYCNDIEEFKQNEYFEFNKKDNDDSIMILDKGFDSLSNYDTYIRDESKNVVASLIYSNNNGYRISFYKSTSTSILELNIIGDSIKTYQLCCYEKNNISDNNSHENGELNLWCNKIYHKINS
jgi:hypothetical protein